MVLSNTRKTFVSLLWLCISICAYLGAEYDPVALYLTWQRHPDTTMTIQWITPLDRHDDLVEYRQADEQEWKRATGTHAQLPKDTPYFLHRIELINLKPATSYHFRTGIDGMIYKFQTMPAEMSEPIRFVAGGDMYHDALEILQEVNQQAALTSPQFALVGGDIAYAADKSIGFLPRWTHPIIDKWFGQKFDRWLTWLIAWKTDMITPEGHLIPMLPVIGNHDVSGRYDQTPEQAPFFYTLFAAMPGIQGYNVLDFGSYMSIFLLDSDHTHPVKGKQAAWLAKTLEQRKEIPHKFAIYHVPAYPSVHSLEEEVGKAIRKYWVPSFDAYHLTAAFENHEHLYKRTHPILNGVIDAQGVMYIGDGGWGVDKPRRPRRLQSKWYLAKATSARHFLLMTVEQDKQTVTAISSDGSVIDQYTWPTTK